MAVRDCLHHQRWHDRHSLSPANQRQHADLGHPACGDKARGSLRPIAGATWPGRRADRNLSRPRGVPGAFRGGAAMLRRLISVGGLAIGVSLAAGVVTAGPALAKGATKAMITGPGLARPIIVADAGEPGQSGKLATLAEQSGLFTVLFGASTIGPETVVPSPPPHAALGPRYALVYTVPGVEPQPGERYGRLRQDLYPHAIGGPLTYTPPGQHGFTQQLPVTGWLRADPALVRTLTHLGLPAASKPASVR